MTLSLAVLALLGVSGALAGLLGAIVGVGGGIIIVPLLTMGLGVDIRIAVATSLVAVVASSTASGSVYAGKGLANLRLGMLLEVATTAGAIVGGLVALRLPTQVLQVLFALVLITVVVLMLRGKEPAAVVADEATEAKGQALVEDETHLGGAYFDPFRKRVVRYRVHRIPFGSAVSFVAGLLSGLLGVGGGFLKVPAMTLAMRVPVKVAAATSNLMIGVTAITSLFVYFANGYVRPLLAAPLALGVTLGAFAGTRVAGRLSPTTLRRIFAVVAFVIAVQMVLKSLGVSLGR